ncbi:CopD family protein [Fluviicola sp.]|uniref:CopD family protein n=1 Tax=Fluviicola sp. TaxID=1917219 RepID=UPI00281B6B27|nr:CopD family protein [Fluviicola sp.]MDR0802207.1 CopD family protein [Fluviicola sp.]
MDFLIENYAVWKALHVIFVVSWFAGLFYMVRLFIYHTEVNLRPDEEKRILQEQFDVMQNRLWYIITTPAMILTVIFGTVMLISNPTLLKMPWMQIKLIFVTILLGYHFICQGIMNRLKLRSSKWQSGHLRIWNEVATLLLVSIVFLVIMKSGLSWVGGVLGFFGIGIALMLGVKLYKKLRKS